MRSLPVLTVYCISLLSLQLLALRSEERPDSDRLDLIHHLFDVSEDQPATSPPPSPGLSPEWLSSLLRRLPAAGARRPVLPSLSWALPSSGSTMQNSNPVHKPPPQLLLLRSRRHLGSRGTHLHHHGQLMRVGCVLGTCQVQNLSHRLYQLIGQSGREDSSPINPKSPHSYG